MRRLLKAVAHLRSDRRKGETEENTLTVKKRLSRFLFLSFKDEFADAVHAAGKGLGKDLGHKSSKSKSKA